MGRPIAQSVRIWSTVLRAYLVLCLGVCTVVILYRAASVFPLVVGANRDEMYNRPTAPVQRLRSANNAIGGVDLSRGGTWMGVTPTGFVAAVTNQRTHGNPKIAKHSRGHIVMDCLRIQAADDIKSWLGTLTPGDFNPFNLLFGDVNGLFVAYAREQITVHELEPGLHVLPNDVINAPDFAKVHRANQLLRPFLEADDESLLQQVVTVLGDRWRPPLDQVQKPPPGSRISHQLARELEALCIRTPLYGTRSSTLVAIDTDSVQHYLYADGPPDETPFVEHVHLLR